MHWNIHTKDAQKSPPTCFGTPWVPFSRSLHSSLLGVYYFNIACTVYSVTS